MGPSGRLPPIPTLLVLLLATAVGMSCVTAPDQGKVLADEYFNLGNTWFDLKKYDQASKAYQKALEWNPSLKVAVLNWARVKAETGDPAGALALLGPLQDSDPTNLVVAQYRAWLTAKASGPAAAADLYAALAARLPGDAPTQFNAGLCLKAAGRPREALAALTAWKALDGKGTPGLTALAEVLDQTGSPDGAQAWAAVASSLPDKDPKRFAPLASRAKGLEAAALYGEAVQAWDEALALPEAPDQPRGEALFRKGTTLLLKIEDFPAGSAAVVAAWKAGYKDAASWKALRGDPAWKYQAPLEAALKSAGVEP